MSKKNAFNDRIACKQAIKLINKQMRFMKISAKPKTINEIRFDHCDY